MAIQTRIGVSSLMGGVLERITLYMQQLSASEPGPTLVDFVDIVNSSSSRSTGNNGSNNSGGSERRRT